MMDDRESLEPLSPEALQEIEALADALVRRLPALSDISTLIDTARQVSIKGGRVEFAFDELMSLESLERNYVMHVLNVLEFNKVRTAVVLGIDTSTLYRKLSLWGLESSPVTSPSERKSAPDGPPQVSEKVPGAR
jgi:DNA-binding NtrC family response regulator